MYTTFHRTWWRNNPDYPSGLEPCAGRKTIIMRHVPTEAEARSICQLYNSTHKPGKLSRKAEYTSE